MQLLIILALLLYGGKSNAGNIIKEVKPVLESIGGEEMREALKGAERITEVLSAVQELAGGAKTAAVADAAGDVTQGSCGDRINFPLAPVSAIADKDIMYSLSRYISQN